MSEYLIFQQERTWKDKLRAWLFPSQYLDLPEVKEPTKFQDVVVTKVTVEFSFLARLKILFSGRCLVETKTLTENLVGQCVTSSVAYPLPPSAKRLATGQH